MDSSERATSTQRPGAAGVPGALTHAALSMAFRSLAVVAVLTVPVVSGLGSVDGAQTVDRRQQDRVTAWEASYSEQYPGCVASALWPAEELPVALVVRTPDGNVDRVALDAQRRSLQHLPAGSTTIGACR